MEKIIPLQINKGRVSSGISFRQKAIEDATPTPTYRDSNRIDCRCIAITNPSVLLDKISNDLSTFDNIATLVRNNPRLRNLLQEHNLEISKGDYINFASYTDKHMKQTARLAGRICNELNIPKEKKANIIKAARLHDIGKIFIPANILNKPDSFTDNERKIMDVHAELGHALLETLKINPETLDLIKHHHTYNPDASIEQQIVSAADVYTALRELRPYKSQKSVKEALDEVSSPKYGFSKEVIEAVKRAVCKGYNS